MKKGKFRTVLQAGCFKSDEIITQLLFDNGADPNKQEVNSAHLFRPPALSDLKKLFNYSWTKEPMSILKKRTMWHSTAGNCVSRAQEFRTASYLDGSRCQKSGRKKRVAFLSSVRWGDDNNDDGGEYESKYGSDDGLFERITPRFSIKFCFH
jgi:hypothetical protein